MNTFVVIIYLKSINQLVFETKTATEILKHVNKNHASNGCSTFFEQKCYHIQQNMLHIYKQVIMNSNTENIFGQYLVETWSCLLQTII